PSLVPQSSNSAIRLGAGHVIEVAEPIALNRFQMSVVWSSKATGAQSPIMRVVSPTGTVRLDVTTFGPAIGAAIYNASGTQMSSAVVSRLEPSDPWSDGHPHLITVVHDPTLRQLRLFVDGR